MRRLLLPLLFPMFLVGAAVTAIHWPALSAGALSFDDQQYLNDNVLVRNPSWSSASRFLTEISTPSTVRGYYQPLTMISLMFDYALGGRPDHLQPFHRTSLILHVLTTISVLFLMYQLFASPVCAALAALLFGAHPMTVEAIAWTSERKTLLAALFAVWSIIFYVAYTRASTQRGPWPRRLLYAGCVLAFLLSILSKPTSTPLPMMLLIMDYWPLKRLSRRAVLEKAPLLLLAAASAGVTYLSQRGTAEAALPSEYGPLRVPLVLLHNIVFYLEKIAWPVNLSSHYPFPKPLSFLHPAVVKGVAGSVLLFAALAISLRWTRAFAAGWLVFFVGMLPTMQIIAFTNVIASDKYAYFPAVGLSMTLAWLLVGVWRPATSPRPTSIRRVGIAAIIVLLAMIEARQTRRYLEVWDTSERLCRHMISLSPNVASLHNMLGLALKDDNRLSEAEEEFGEAIRLKSEYANAYSNLARLYVMQGRLKDATIVYREVLKIEPRMEQAHNNLANTLCQLGRLEEAVPHFEEAIRLKPSLLQPRQNLARALHLLGRLDEAARCYEEVIRMSPETVSAHLMYGAVLRDLGRLTEAEQEHRQAARLAPMEAETYYQLGLDLEAQGRTREASEAYRQALERKASHVNARRRLSAVLSLPGGAPVE